MPKNTEDFYLDIISDDKPYYMAMMKGVRVRLIELAKRYVEPGSRKELLSEKKEIIDMDVLKKRYNEVKKGLAKGPGLHN